MGREKRNLVELESSIRELAAAREEKGRELAGIKEELLKDDQEQASLELKSKEGEEEEKRLTENWRRSRPSGRKSPPNWHRRKRPYGTWKTGAAKLPPPPTV